MTDHVRLYKNCGYIPIYDQTRVFTEKYEKNIDFNFVLWRLAHILAPHKGQILVNSLIIIRVIITKTVILKNS